MKENKKKPFLYFNFIDHSGKLNPLQFSNPIQILTAQTIDEIIPCMEIVQQAVNKGLYAAGYISYEAAPAFDEELPVKKGNVMPLLWFGIFNKPIHQKLQHINQNDMYIKEWISNVLVEDYNKNFNHIQHSIKSNQTKQVNYTIPFEAQFSGNPLSLYKQLEDAQSSNYTAYLDIGDFSIISASPELFFQLKDRKITTKPMKGTIGRGLTYQDDRQFAKQLKNSKKDQTENRLIIELMRNELEEIALPGTINVPKLYTIEKYPTVYQMTSTITAQIEENIGLIDIFKALFPCGSITGIPKRDTMDIITRLETTPREVYCGAIGYITPHHKAIFNVPIRTVLIDKKSGVAQYGAGGAITNDSKKENEYEEILIKTRLLTKKQKSFQLLESFGLVNGQYLFFKQHMKRLKESASYFDFILHLDKIQKNLIDLAHNHKQGKWKVRLLVNKNGNHSIDTEKLIPHTGELAVKLANKPIDKNDLFLYHKTTHRSIYETNRIYNDEVFDTLLWNKNGEITEFTMGNIIVELNNKLYTPPVQSGLLAGTFREYLLAEGKIIERKILKNELDLCDNIWFINSVRKWVPVQLLKSNNR